MSSHFDSTLQFEDRCSDQVVFARDLPAGGSRLPSKVDAMDQFFSGGLQYGKVYEFGIPTTQEGRLLLCPFLKSASEKHQKILWIHSTKFLHVNPLFLFSRGIAESDVVFAFADSPIKELKHAISSPVFNLVVFDGTGRWTKKDSQYLSTLARINKQIFIIIRSYYLSNKIGNVWAAVRVNIRALSEHSSRRGIPPNKDSFQLFAVRGLHQKKAILSSQLAR